jgi:hypothetical protein
VAKHDETASRRRRQFLKAAGGAAIGFVATQDALGQSALSKSTVRKSPLPDEPADRGLWVTWYDLPEDGREAYLSWLHGTYLPELLKRPGYVWAAHYATRDSEVNPQLHHTDDPSVPTGFRYILLIGAMDAFVLGNPVPSSIHAALPAGGRKMLAMRIGERVNLLTETGRCEGRGRASYKEGPLSAPCIQIGSYNCPFQYEEEAGRIRSVAAAGDVRHRDVRQDAEAEFRCRMGQARDSLRVRVPRRLQTRLRRHGCESKGPDRAGRTFGGSDAGPRA